MTIGLRLTCDRAQGLCRAALWRKGEIVGLYLDSLTTPDMTGALVAAKAVRVTAKGTAAWFNTENGLSVYVENVGSLRTGEICALRIRTTRPEGKAATGVLEESAGHALLAPLGLLEPPPSPWQRALLDARGEEIECSFSSPEDLAIYRQLFSANDRMRVSPCASSSAHPELDDILETLKIRRVALPCGGDVAIDQTETLTAIDVNAPEGADPTTINCMAMRAIARQLRLRNIGGIVMIDALKMKARADASKVLGALKRAGEEDPTPCTVFGFTKLGLIEMTRARRGPSFKEIVDR